MLGGVIEDDFPAVVGVFDDEGEEAFDVATIFPAALEMVFAEDDGEVLVERMYLKVGISESAHGGLGRVVALVFIEQTSEAAEDLVGDEERVGRVFEAAREGGEISLVPGVLLGDENFDDVQLLAAGGVERVGLLGSEESRCEEG